MTQGHSEDNHVNMRAEFGVLLPQAKECQEPPENWKSKDMLLYRGILEQVWPF